MQMEINKNNKYMLVAKGNYKYMKGSYTNGNE